MPFYISKFCINTIYEEIDEVFNDFLYDENGFTLVLY